MRVKPKDISDQVVVITGGSSGIGRAAAREFAANGARVVIIARSEQALRETQQEIREAGAQCCYFAADVSRCHELERAARLVRDTFGRIDVWINNAAVSEYATVEDITVEEIDRILHVDLFGTIYGTKAVLPYLVEQGNGHIINISSVVGSRPVPLLAAYSAAKSGINGFTRSLRIEMMATHPGIEISLVMPASINTPFFRHARSRMAEAPKPIPPVYEPGLVARALVELVRRPQAEIVVGDAGKAMVELNKFIPGLLERYMAAGKRGFREQQADHPPAPGDNLFEPLPGTDRVEGEFGKDAVSGSWYTEGMEVHPWRTGAMIAAGLLGLASAAGALMGMRRRGGASMRELQPELDPRGRSVA